MNVAELHRALADRGYEVSYEKLRRAWDGQRKTELDYTIIKWIAEVTDADPAFVVGDEDAPYPDIIKGVYLSSECVEDTDCLNYVDSKGKCVRIDHCPLVLQD